MPTELAERVRAFPRTPGCYQWKDAEGNVLYVGMATDLRARVGSYLSRRLEDRIGQMVSLATSVDFVATPSVKEALVLEQTLIKRHRPPYNVMMVDDKKYPYIAITGDEYPRVVYTRNVDASWTSFGPFPDAWAAKRVARMLNREFKLRQCRTLPKRECLYYHLRQCTAPCIGAVTRDEYGQQAQTAKAFLEGGGRAIARTLRARMQDASGQLQFEQAAQLRDLSDAIESVMQRQYADNQTGKDADAVGLAQREDRACAVVVFVRDGAVVGKEHYFMSHAQGSGPAQVVEAFLRQYYTNPVRAAREILLPLRIDDAAPLEAAWSQIQGRRVRIRVPERGTARRHVELATENANLLLEQEFLIRERRGTAALEELRDALALDEIPTRIEAFDISHSRGEHTVASMVVLAEGKPLKSAYRKFRIRTTAGGDDPGAMREAVRRRYERVLLEEGADALPDLVLVDGGRTQLGAAREALKELGLQAMPIAGLAKRLEEVHLPNRLHPVRIPTTSPALHMLQRARDEAHRFAVRYQDTLARKALTRSALDDIPGIGPERRRRLLRAFGSVDALRRASEDDLSRVPGITRPLARRIVQTLKASTAHGPG